MECEVIHESYFGSRTKVGFGDNLLTKMFPALLQPIQAKIDLSYSKDNQTISKGYVLLVGYLCYVDSKLNIPLIPRNILKIPATSQTATLAFTTTHLQVHSLPDHGNLLDGQDPCLVLSVGPVQKKETERKKDAGANALFSETFLFEINASEVLNEGRIAAAVVNKDHFGNKTPIGEGSVLIKDVIHNFNKPNFVRIDLTDKKGPSGYVLFEGTLAASSSMKPEPNKLPLNEENEIPKQKKPEVTAESSTSGKYDAKNFTVGELKITEIICQDLVNVEMSGKNDPYVVLHYATKEFRTDAIEDGGSNVKFESVNFIWDNITRDILDFEEIKVTVADRNSWRSDQQIGSTSCSLSVLYDHINEDRVQIPLTIFNDKKKSSGKVILVGKLTPIEELQKNTVSQEMIKSFLSNFDQGGELHLIRARAYDLAKTKNEIFSFSLNFDREWKYQSTKLDMSSVELPVFDHLEQKISINRQHFESNSSFTLEFSHQEYLMNSLIGKGTVSITQLFSSIDALQEKEAFLTFDLVGNKGAKAGKVVFTVRIINSKSLTNLNQLTLPAEFLKGNLRISKVEANGLKNVELFGKQDPYVRILHPPSQWKVQTKTVSNAGLDVEWENVNFLFSDFSKEQVLADEKFLVEVYDDNNLRGDAIIGSAEISMKLAAQNMKNEVPITVIIQDKSKAKKNSGRVTLYVTLTPQEKKEPPKNIPSVFIELIKIITEDMNSGNLFSTAPQLEMKYNIPSSDPFLYLTPPHKEEGSNPQWDNLLIQSKDFPSTQCSTEPLNITFIDEKKLIATATIPNLSDAFLNIGEATHSTVEFLHPKAKKKIGQAHIVFRLIPSNERKEVVNATVKKVIDRPIDFEIGELFVKKIIVHNLKNTEWIGKSDPFVLVKYQEWIGQTPVLNNAGGDIIYDNVDFQIEVSANEFLDPQNVPESGPSSRQEQPKQLEISVFDKNDYRNNVLVGEAFFPMARYVYNVNQEITVEQDILDKKKRVKVGSVTLIAELRKIDASSMKQLPKDFKKGLIEIFKISTFELKNRELIGNQDPFVVVKFQDQVIDQTPVIDNGGSDCVFDLLEIRNLITREDIDKGVYTLEVWDKDRMGKKLIGLGKTKIHVVRELDREYQLSMRLLDHNSNYCGRLLVFLRMIDGENIDAATLMEKSEEKITKPLPKEFQKVAFIIEKVVASHLKDIGSTLVTTQNPFVEVEYGSWKDRTLSFQEVVQKDNVKFSGGKDCIWDVVDLSTIVDTSTIERDDFTVTVRNTSIMSKNHEIIGVGRTKLVKAVNHYPEPVKLEVPIFDAKRPDVKTGKVTLFAKLEALDSDEQDDGTPIEIPKDFEYGVLKISAIEAFHLKNTEIMGKQDPYVKIQYGNIWKEKTYTQENAGTQAKWEHLPYECEIYPDNLLNPNNTLEVSVMDENSTRSHVLIGKATIPNLKRNLKHLNQEVTYTLTLLDAKQKISGKCKLYCSLSIPEPEVEIPEGLQSANVRIKRISMFGVKNTEFFGLSKIDPFVVVKYNDQTHTTKALKNAGGNVEWTDLDYDSLCDSKQLRVGAVECEVYTSKTLLGKGSVLIKELYHPNGNDCEKTCNLITDKGQVAGKLTLQGQIISEKKYVAPNLDLPKEFTVGHVLISYLEGSQLKNTELLGKQDPYCRLTIGDWSETTCTLNNAGSNPVWPSLEMSAEVNRDVLANEQLVVQFFDQNFSRKDKPLGQGSVSLRPLCPRINQPTELAIDIVDSNGAIMSKAKLIAKLVLGDEKNALEGLPESVVKIEKGILQITDIRGYDLRGSDFSFLGDKQDPYCILEIGDWNHRTHTVKNVTRTFAWSDLQDVQTLVTKDILKLRRLSITVMDSGISLSGGFLGKGDISLRKAGMALERLDTYTIRLKDVRGRNAGRLEVKMIIQPIPVEPQADPSLKGKEVGNSAIVTGKLQVLKLQFTELKHGTSTFGKNSVYAKVNLPPSWSQTLPVIQQAGNENGWNSLKLETEKFARSHLEKEGLKIEFFSKSSITSDASIGVAQFPLTMATQKSNEWVTIPSQINIQGQFAGKCVMQARFASDETILAQGLAGEEERNSLKISNDTLQKRVSQLEQSLRQQLHKEIAEERDALLEKMKTQNAELKGMLEAALKKMKKSKDEEKQVASEPTDQQMPDITDIQLPKNISRWRSAHVQAWLAFQIGLPQYIDAFADASIDGLLLLKHIDHKHLKDFLKIENEMHRTKILLGIQQLKEKQSKYEQLLEQKRKEKETERLRRLQREEEERKRKEALDKKKNKGKKVKPLPTMSKPEFIDNGINRVKLEKALKDQNQILREKQKKLSQQYQRYNKTWQFEYTGNAKPEEKDAMLSDTVWNQLDRAHNHQSKPELGSKAYQKMMKNTILQDVTPVQREIREIPKTCSTDEVLAVVKGAMFEVSNWLLKLEEMNYKKQYLLDNDLDEFFLEEADEERLNMELADADVDANSAENELPPSYSHYLDETNSIPNPSIAEKKEESGPGIVELDDDDEAPPDYEEALHSKDVLPTKSKDKEIDLLSPAKEQESTSSLLPAPNVDIPPPPSNSDKRLERQTKSRKRQQLTELLLQSQQQQYQDLSMPPHYETDRMKLIYRAFIDQTNNRAHWLGNNQKLTRLKLEGGIENLLKLKLSWEQFDMLWTRLDYQRSGDIDYIEFVKFFGNLNEFLTHEGMNHLTLTRGTTGAAVSNNKTQYYNAQGELTGGNKSAEDEMKILVEYLYYFVDTLRKTNFTIIDIFSSFDRNGSGDISLSEFCSLLRLVLGPQLDDHNSKRFDRKLIYRALNVLDVDGNKSISLQELLFFIYRIWKTQLQDLANEISYLTTELHQNDDDNEPQTAMLTMNQQQKKTNQKKKELIQKLLQEREDIKSAVKRNYPRHWRDKLERLGMETNAIPGPFTHLLNQMHIITEESADANFTSTNTHKQPLSVDTIKNDDFTNFFETSKGSRNNAPFMSQTVPSRQSSLSPHRETTSGGTLNREAAYLSASSPAKKPGRTYLSGHNSLLRFKIRMPAGAPPVRTATHNHQPMKLSVPTIKSLDNNPDMITGETTNKVLNEFDYMAGMMH